MRVVLDTNVLVSAVVFRGPPREVLSRALRGEDTLLLCDEIVDELTSVLRGRKFRYTAAAAEAVVAELRAVAVPVTLRHRITVVHQDPADNRILECAVDGRAEVLIRGDRHLLVLREFHELPILSPAEYLAGTLPAD